MKTKKVKFEMGSVKSNDCSRRPLTLVLSLSIVSIVISVTTLVRNELYHNQHSGLNTECCKLSPNEMKDSDLRYGKLENEVKKIQRVINSYMWVIDKGIVPLNILQELNALFHQLKVKMFDYVSLSLRC